jgi:hypothetical protein
VRKVLPIGIAAVVGAIAMSGVDSGATGKRCGTKYTKPCTIPSVNLRTPPVVCHKPSTSFDLPAATLTSLPGMRKIVVTEDGKKVLKSVSFKGQGPQQYSVSRLKISTAGLKSGVHSITITVTDVRGKKASRTVRFSVCASVPVFTG